MKNKIILSPIILLSVIFGCSKPRLQNGGQDAYPIAAQWTTNKVIDFPVSPIVRPIPLPPTSPRLPELCVQDATEFYSFLWDLPHGPATTCPYASYALQTVKVTFTDGNVIYCQPTLINGSGTLGYGGIALQDISCNGPIDGFITYVILTYYEYMGGQASETFPLYGCGFNTTYPTYGEFRMIKNGTTYILHSMGTDFSYPIMGQIVTRTIKTMEFL